MLARELRQDLYPQHAAEVRENIVPHTSFFLSTSLDF